MLAEAIPIAELVGLVAVAALVPYALASLMDLSMFGAVLAIVTRFVLAVGAGVVLLYVVARGVQLADE